MEKSKNIVKKVRAFFYKDFRWKLLSLALAFILWFVGVNVNNPIQIINYDNLPLTVHNRDQLALNNVVLLNEHQVNNTRISAGIRATRSNHSLINNSRADNIQASIDLSEIDFDRVLENGGPVRVPVDVSMLINQDYMTSLPRPYVVELELDRHGDITFPIMVDVTGTPAEGFESRLPVVAQGLVRLTAAQSVLDEVASVRVRVNTEDAYETVEDVYPLAVYNRDGEMVTNTVNLSLQTVHVRVPILPYADIRLEVDTIGAAMPDFMVTSVTIEPSVASLVGPAEEIEALSMLVLGVVDIDSADQTLEQTFDIRQALAGTGLTLRAGAPGEAVATLVVEQVISRNLSLPLNRLNASGNTQPFTFTGVGPVTLSLRGTESVVNAMGLNQITASINLEGLGAGTHTVPVSVTMPQGVALANLITVGVVIEPEPVIPEPPEEQPPELNGEEDDYENGEENGYEENGEDNGYDVGDEEDSEDLEEEGDE